MTNVKNLMSENFPTVVGERSVGEYTMKDILRKPLKRGSWNDGYNSFKTGFRRASVESRYRDYDGAASLQLQTASSWTDSPTISIKAMFPVHVDCNGRISFGYGTDTEEWKGREEERKLYSTFIFKVECPKTGNVDTFHFSFSEMAEEWSYESVKEFGQELVNLFKEFRLMEAFLEEDVYID